MGCFQEEELLLIALTSHIVLAWGTHKFSKEGGGSVALNSLLPSDNASKSQSENWEPWF